MKIRIFFFNVHFQTAEVMRILILTHWYHCGCCRTNIKNWGILNDQNLDLIFLNEGKLGFQELQIVGIYEKKDTTPNR